MAKLPSWDGAFLVRPKQLPAESGTVAPTDKKTQKLQARANKQDKPKHKKRG